MHQIDVQLSRLLARQVLDELGQCGVLQLPQLDARVNEAVLGLAGWGARVAGGRVVRLVLYVREK